MRYSGVAKRKQAGEVGIISFGRHVVSNDTPLIRNLIEDLVIETGWSANKVNAVIGEKMACGVLSGKVMRSLLTMDAGC